jgi:tRNA (guanosine-2'-O-)-methyltransferase
MPALDELLATQITPERLRRLHEVLAYRTDYLQIVLEDIYQGHNAAAVLRSCECFGVQNIHCIEAKNKFNPSREISMGASKWLSLHRWQSTQECLHALKNQGVRLVAMTLQTPSIPLDQIPLDRPTALIFGTEEQGLSPLAHQYADIYAHLPMYGFTQSYNISVSAALSLQTLIPNIHKLHQWQLSPDRQRELYLHWLKLCVPHWQALADRGATPPSEQR